MPSCKENVASGSIKIALLGHFVTNTSPSGQCVIALIRGLREKVDFDIYSLSSDISELDGVRFFQIFSFRRPLFALYAIFHIACAIRYGINRVLGKRYDETLCIDGSVAFGSICYLHFCHRAFLSKGSARPTLASPRRLFRWINHRLRAMAEPWVLRSCRKVVVPSMGLRRELEVHYPFVRNKAVVIPNPIDLEYLRRPDTFNVDDYRSKFHVGCDDFLLVFVALGDFERKGLHLVLDALNELSDLPVYLWVVGGPRDLVWMWERRVRAAGISGRVRFIGMQQDVRPYLWAADAFVLPSSYEVFPLVSLEAAAACLPLIVTPLNGVEEFMVDGETGFVVEASGLSIAAAIRRLYAMDPGERSRVGTAACEAVKGYSADQFVRAWHEVLLGTKQDRSFPPYPKPTGKA